MRRRRNTKLAAELYDLAAEPGQFEPAAALEIQRHRRLHGRRRVAGKIENLLERGNRLELPWLSGKVAELGRQLGVPTPTHSMMYAMLKPYVMGRRAEKAALSS